MGQPGEPSVEEILESIKKVIARDNRAGAAEQRKARESDGIAEADGDEMEEAVLDLGAAAEFVGHDEDEADLAETPLVNSGARDSMRESLAALAMLAEPGAPPQIVRSGETSLEGLTRDLLRPALTEWLDKHLPAMVEKMVAAEIAKIVGKKG